MSHEGETQLHDNKTFKQARFYSLSIYFLIHFNKHLICMLKYAEVQEFYKNMEFLLFFFSLSVLSLTLA